MLYVLPLTERIAGHWTVWRTRTRPTASLKPRASHPPSLMLTNRLECEIAPFLTCVYCMLIAHLGTLPTSTITSQHNGLSSHYRKPFSDLALGSSTASVPSSGTPKFVTSHGFDPFGATLAQAQGKLFCDPQLDIINPLPHEKVFIVSWVDYCNKYGLRTHRWDRGCLFQR